MAELLTVDQIETLIDALCKAFWHKRPFRDFLRRCGVSQVDLKEIDRQQTKRTFLRWLFERYENGPQGHQIMRDIALGLAAKSVFPDLEPDQIRVAKIAIQNLAECFSEVSLRQQQPARARSSAAVDEMKTTEQLDLAQYRRRFDDLLPELGTSVGGRKFETWLIEVAKAHGLSARGKYTAAGREFDGSVVVDQTTYLLELKFTANKSDAPDVSNFRDKLNGHAAGTLGLFVGVSGFTATAVDVASRAGSPVLLCDGAHLYRVLQGLRLDDLVRTMRRHALETGRAYLAVQELT